jgi:hypothetical protein
VLLAPRLASGEGFEDLPIAVEVRVVKTAEHELARVERLLRAQRGVDAGHVANLTIPLQNLVEDGLGDGPVTIFPRAVYQICLIGLRSGAKREQLAAELVAYQKNGTLGRVARGEEPPPNPAH